MNIDWSLAFKLILAAAMIQFSGMAFAEAVLSLMYDRDLLSHGQKMLVGGVAMFFGYCTLRWAEYQVVTFWRSQISRRGS
jgi:hypothetical protein